MQFKELLNTNADDLRKKQKELELELLKEQGSIAAGTTPKSPGHVRNVKKNIARIKHALSVLEAKQQ